MLKFLKTAEAVEDATIDVAVVAEDAMIEKVEKDAVAAVIDGLVQEEILEAEVKEEVATSPDQDAQEAILNRVVQLQTELHDVLVGILAQAIQEFQDQDVLDAN